MKKSIVVLLHSAYWACYSLLLFFIFLATAFQSTSTPEAAYVFKLVSGFFVLPALLSFYSSYLVLFQRFLQPRKIAQLLVSMVGVSIVSGIVGAAWIALLLGPELLTRDGATSLFQILVVITVIAFGNSVTALILKGAISWYQELKLKEELVLKTPATELALVKAQLDPHFLFNTINNIDVLIAKNASQASVYLNKLSDILRFMLFSAKTERIVLTKEVEYIQKFIELQKIRSENQGYVRFDCEGCLEKWQIEPMLLIPFVENAFKHATGKKLDDSILIHLNATDDQLQFTCKNRFLASKSSEIDANGLGSELMARRLQLLYPACHDLETTVENNYYHIALTLQKHA